VSCCTSTPRSCSPGGRRVGVRRLGRAQPSNGVEDAGDADEDEDEDQDEEEEEEEEAATAEAAEEDAEEDAGGAATATVANPSGLAKVLRTAATRWSAARCRSVAHSGMWCLPAATWRSRQPARVKMRVHAVSWQGKRPSSAACCLSDCCCCCFFWCLPCNLSKPRALLASRSRLRCSGVRKRDSCCSLAKSSAYLPSRSAGWRESAMTLNDAGRSSTGATLKVIDSHAEGTLENQPQQSAATARDVRSHLA
jgi:hypothetical protein